MTSGTLSSVTSDFLVRPAEPRDLPTLGRLGAALVEYHRALDPRRYMNLEDAAVGYARFLGGELSDPRAIVLVAVGEPAGSVVGYCYGTVEGRDWNALLDPHGSLRDVLVDPGARRRGVAEKLVLAMCSCLESVGVPRVVLHTAVQNREAQALFAKLGFRSTMLEMTREAGGGP